MSSRWAVSSSTRTMIGRARRGADGIAGSLILICRSCQEKDGARDGNAYILARYRPLLCSDSLRASVGSGGRPQTCSEPSRPGIVHTLLIRRNVMKLESVDRDITIQSANVHLGDGLPSHARESILRVA